MAGSVRSGDRVAALGDDQGRRSLEGVGFGDLSP